MSSNIFGGQNKETEQFQEKVDTHTKTLLSIIQRQKDLESNVELLNEKLLMLDHNQVKTAKSNHIDIREIRDDIKQIKAEINSIKEFNEKMIKQIKLMSQKDEVAKLERYIVLWNPMQFVTRDELEEYSTKIKTDLSKIIKDFLDDK